MGAAVTPVPGIKKETLQIAGPLVRTVVGAQLVCAVYLPAVGTATATVVTAAEATTAAATLAGAGLVDLQAAAAHVRTVESAHRLIGIGLRHLDETESTR